MASRARFAYAIGFPSLLTAAMSGANLWTCNPVAEGVGFLLLPLLVLICINLLGVKVGPGCVLWPHGAQLW